MIYKFNKKIKIAPLRYLIIDPKYRNKQFGVKIFEHTLKYLSSISNIITTGLEIHNIPSLNLHIKLGFKFSYIYSVFHKWFNNI